MSKQKKEYKRVTPDEEALNIFTDGSSHPTPRRGGMGAILVYVDQDTGDPIVEDIPLQGYKQGASGEMELNACLESLIDVSRHPMLSQVKRIVIFTDSQYVSESFKKLPFWKRQRWKDAHGRPYDNAKLWAQLLKQVERMPIPVKIEWVKGHAKNEYNKKADKAAKSSALGVLKKPLRVQQVRRKKTTGETELGSVEMQGQEMDIYIVTSEWLPMQRTNKYRYEVLSEDSEYYGKLDMIYSDEDLRAAHSYRVRVGDNKMYPVVVEKLRDITPTSS